jgi:hypothetical protein
MDSICPPYFAEFLPSMGGYHVQRKSNGAAHMLTKIAVLVRDEVVHIEEASQCVIGIVMAEHSDVHFILLMKYVNDFFFFF